MIPNDISPFEMDDGSERRRILAKVYSLLIRLAEEQENSFSPTATDKQDEEAGKPVIAPTDHTDIEVCPELDPDITVPSIEQTNNSVP